MSEMISFFSQFDKISDSEMLVMLQRVMILYSIPLHFKQGINLRLLLRLVIDFFLYIFWVVIYWHSATLLIISTSCR